VDQCWELNGKQYDLPRKTKRLKPTYAAVEKLTIPPEVFYKSMHCLLYQKCRTIFSKNSLNSTLAKDQDPMSLLLKRPTLPMPQDLVYHRRKKHILVQYHFVREVLEMARSMC
jgi:hypothetical protein